MKSELDKPLTQGQFILFHLEKIKLIYLYLGFFVGLLSIVSGVSGLMFDIPPSVAYANFEDSRNLFTSIILIVFGF